MKAREEFDKGKEERFIAITKGNSFYELDFIVEALEFSGRNGKESMSNQALNARENPKLCVNREAA